jgi:FtsH-binding integral membrane protein
VNTLTFSFVWTLLFSAGVVYLWTQPQFESQSLWFKVIFSLCPLGGVFFIVDSWRKVRRYKSVRCERDGSQLWYVWTEINGEEKRSLQDPRQTWDAEDKNFAD